MNTIPVEFHDKTYGENQKDWEKRINYAIDELSDDPDVQKYEND